MHARRLRITAAVLTATAVLATSACSSNGSDAGTSTRGIALFGTDGIMSNSFGTEVKTPGELAGMSGTAPLMPFSNGFEQRVRSIDPTLDDFTYSGQAYDAVVIAALAAQIAGSTDGTTIAKYINGVTTLQAGGIECATFAKCLAAIATGKDIAYRGVTVDTGFTSVGEPSTSTYGTQHFGSQNQIDAQKTEYVSAGDPNTATTTKPPAPSATTATYHGPALNMGLLLPKTGGLAENGKPIFAAAKLAIKDVNAAGGVLGKPITTETQDDGTDVTKATNGAKALISAGANVIIGPSFSGAAEAVVPLGVAAGVVIFSPSATSAVLTTIDDHGMFFRTAPSDILQAQAIADVIMRSGAQRVFIVARSDTYGTGLEKDVKAALITGGLPSEDLQTAEYSADSKADNTATFSRIAHDISSFQSDSVLLLGYEETTGVISAMVSAHLQFRTS
jgi:ABC-type branched-subunit amino acid transport system substrate-binding protein